MGCQSTHRPIISVKDGNLLLSSNISFICIDPYLLAVKLLSSTLFFDHLFPLCCPTINQRASESQAKYSKGLPKEEDEGLDEEDEEEHGETLCGACGDNNASDEFWICCDICEQWFHGKCVKITPARAEHIKQYKCPSCSNKRTRPS